MANRRRISARDRTALFAREHGTCHMCGGIVHAGEAWDVSHEIPLALGGADDESNWKVAHRKCHRVTTATVDVPNIARAKRREARHIGASKPKGSIPKPPSENDRRKSEPVEVARGVSNIWRRFQ